MATLITVGESSNSRADESMEDKFRENKRGSGHELPQRHGLDGLSTDGSIGQKGFHKESSDREQ